MISIKFDKHYIAHLETYVSETTQLPFCSVNRSITSLSNPAHTAPTGKPNVRQQAAQISHHSKWILRRCWSHVDVFTWQNLSQSFRFSMCCVTVKGHVAGQRPIRTNLYYFRRDVGIEQCLTIKGPVKKDTCREIKIRGPHCERCHVTLRQIT